MGLRNKKILITAGPTWVPIDSVRVISNIATGTTGRLLAAKALAQGARVTLVLGGGRSFSPKVLKAHDQSARIVHFCFFNELKDILKRELKNNKYDIVIHSAAVSDFRPAHRTKRKLSSDRGAKLVIFKLETAVTDRVLIQRAKNAREEVGADSVVANRLVPYRAFIIDKDDNQIKAQSKQELAKELIKILLKK